jgi:hypothetical protein
MCLGKVVNVIFMWLREVECSWINMALEVVIEVEILNWMDVVIYI